MSETAGLLAGGVVLGYLPALVQDTHVLSTVLMYGYGSSLLLVWVSLGPEDGCIPQGCPLSMMCTAALCFALVKVS